MIKWIVKYVLGKCLTRANLVKWVGDGLERLCAKADGEKLKTVCTYASAISDDVGMVSLAVADGKLDEVERNELILTVERRLDKALTDEFLDDLVERLAAKF